MGSCAWWNGFNILATDGTSLQVPDTKECGEYFGLISNQNKTRTAVATASALYDVLNDIIVDARITKSRNRKKTLNNLIEKAIKIRSQVKSNRSCERKNKHPRKKHHHNIKSCI